MSYPITFLMMKKPFGKSLYRNKGDRSRLDHTLGFWQNLFGGDDYFSDDHSQEKFSLAQHYGDAEPGTGQETEDLPF